MSEFELVFEAPFGGGTSEALEPHARMLAALLPPGELWRFVGSVLEQVLLGCAEELARVYDRVQDLLREADPTQAIETLAEYEADLGLTAAATEEERRANIVAKLVRRQRYRPEDFRVALAPLLGQAIEDVEVIERTHAMAVALGDDREIFRFFVYRNPLQPGDYFVDSAQARLDEMKPSHTIGHVIESVDFLCDDEFSLVDRDLLGA